ncbi:MAG TPA: xanthine dehydrogenase family protein subunit M [Verrucomicrobia bacterium]|nr:xanthine dehydrogenase family protein subunit M [Verrucomicrobiota bacterium]HOP96383.1 FAD binding domain-containing protein [Verrucomicrobiota bacterium]
MKAFEYATALTPASARELVADGGAYLAGGNDLLNMMKDHLVEPTRLVNIKSLPGLNRIQPGPQTWTLGALVTVAEIEDHAELKKTFPGLQQAAAEAASRQIRNVATLGGNLAQHSRCWYFRHRDTLCLKKGGDTCYARHGENKYHSLFTGNTCISPVVSNLAVALAVLDATVVVDREGKEMRMTIPEFYAKAWDNPMAHNSLSPGDLILRVEIPVQNRRSAYQQISEKASFDWALVSCAASARVEGGKVTQARIALGSISPVPHLVKAANDFLEGKELNEETAGQAAELMLQRARPQRHNGYKIPMARALIRRTLLQLIA